LRPLFTKNSTGDLVRNYYCSECFIGPFNQRDIDNHILVEVGFGNQTARFCRKCAKLKLPKMVLHAVEEQYLEREKHVLSGKVLEDIKVQENFQEKIVISPFKICI
jgi:hypothetical protein